MNVTAECPDQTAIKRMLTGKLNPDQLAEIAQHISSCAACQKSYEQQAKEVVDSVRGGQSNEHPEETDAELRRIVGSLKSCGAATIAEEPSKTTNAKSASPPIDLSFLADSDSPESLGRIGIYEITGVIGQGGMGIVLKALDPQLNRFVAIKVLNPQWGSNANSRKRFLREARAAAAVSHDHVVTIHAVDESNGLPFLVMEFISGRSLDERIRRDGALKLREILRIGMQAASGLAAAHAQGLVHRDIKPGNILLENGVERVKITDFGLARAIDDVQITHEGMVAGTPEFMSPEQVDGETVNHLSDLFSLGSVLYCMCTGRSPFRGSTIAHAMRRVHDDTPRPINEVNPEIPDWLVEIIDRLLEKNPEDRIQSADKVVDLLGGHLAHLQQPAVSPRPSRLSIPTRSDSKAPATRWLLTTGPALLILAGLMFLPNLIHPRSSAILHAEVENTSDGQLPEKLIDIKKGFEHRAEGNQELAIELFQHNLKLHSQRDNYEGVTWALIRQARAYSDVHDFEQAIAMIREAMSDQQRFDLTNDYTRLAALRELAVMIDRYGNPQEAKTLSDLVVKRFSALKNIQQKVWGIPTDQISKIECEMISDDQFTRDKYWPRLENLLELSNDDWSKSLVYRLRGIALERDDDLENAIVAYEKAANHRMLFNEIDNGSWAEDRLLELYLKTNQRDRAVDFFRQLVDQRSKELHQNHPSQAFSRVLLSKAIAYEHKGSPELVSLLTEAKRVVDHGKLFPDKVTREIESLLRRANSAAPSLPQTGTLHLDKTNEKGIRVSLARNNQVWVLQPKNSPFELPTGLYDVKVENLPRGEVMRQGQIEITGGVERKLEFFFPNMRPELPQRQATKTLVGSEIAPGNLMMSGSGKRLFTVTWDSRASMWELIDGEWTQRWSKKLPAEIAALSPDGNRIVVGGNYGRIYVYDANTGEQAGPHLDGHSTKIRAIAFGPKGQVLVSGDEHGIAKVWDCQTWSLKHEIESHSSWVKAIAVSGDASRFATSGGSNDRRVKIWDLASGSPLHTLVGHTGKIDHLDFSPDSSVLASSGEDGMIFVWDSQSGRQIARFGERGCWYPPPIKFSPSGKRLAIGSGHSISVWDWKRNMMIDKYNADWGGMTGLAFTPNGKDLVSSNTSNAIKFWEFDDTKEDGQAMEPAPRYAFNRWSAAFGGPPAFLSYSQAGLLAVGGYDRGVEMWDMKSLSPISKPATRPSVLNLSFTNDDRLMTIDTEEKWNNTSLKLWDGDTLLNSFPLGASQMFPPIDAGDGRVIVHRPLRQGYAPTRLISLEDEKTIRVFPDELGQHCSVAYSYREDVVAIGTWKGKVLLFHPSQDELLSDPLDHQDAFVHAIAMASHASVMATGDETGTVRVWDIADQEEPKEIHLLDAHKETVIDADFSNDGKYLATVGGDWDYTIKNHISEICIWDVATGNLLAKLEGHSEGVWHCEFSPDGRMLATASLDCRVKVWDVQELIDFGAQMKASEK